MTVEIKVTVVVVDCAKRKTRCKNLTSERKSRIRVWIFGSVNFES